MENEIEKNKEKYEEIIKASENGKGGLKKYIQEH